jgi:hypothetical protein
MVTHGRRILRRRMWLPGVALGVVWAMHVVAYLVASPDPHAREALLGATGHGYLSIAGPAAVSVLIAGVAGFFVDRLRRSDGTLSFTVGELAARLIALQCLSFLGLEATERLLHGAPLDALLQPVVGIGLVLQIVGACVAALVLFAFGRVIELALHARRGARRRERGPLRPRIVRPVRRPVLAVGDRTLRGPPLRI